MKTYIYKVYDASGNYITTWQDDVISEPSFTQEINSAGSEMVINLARSPDNLGENDNLSLNNIVKVYVKDTEITEPDIIFQGYISSYAPYYNQKDEGVQVTILTFGDTLKDFVLAENEVPDQSQATGSNTETFGGDKKIAQSFIPDVNTLTSVDIKMAVTMPRTIYLSIQTNGSSEPSGTTVANGSTTLIVSDTTASVQRFIFTTPVDLTIGSTYWLVLEA